ncbi:hypothetical protein I317_00276 [Kwoniella heveanensis CBS 569]|nr:hypothetical protein I317_00276 [Kwoniella heveanensis CBS 569]
MADLDHRASTQPASDYGTLKFLSDLCQRRLHDPEDTGPPLTDADIQTVQTILTQEPFNENPDYFLKAYFGIGRPHHHHHDHSVKDAEGTSQAASQGLSEAANSTDSVTSWLSRVTRVTSAVSNVATMILGDLSWTVDGVIRNLEGEDDTQETLPAIPGEDQQSA